MHFAPVGVVELRLPLLQDIRHGRSARLLVRPLIDSFIERHRLLTLVVDRGSILLIAYSAFSAGVVAGIWSRLGAETLTVLVAADLALLLVVTLIFVR